MRTIDRLDEKVKAGISELPILRPSERKSVDHEIFPVVLMHPNGEPEPVYFVSLVVPLDAADQVAPMSRVDPYAPQGAVTALVSALYERACEMRDEHIRQHAPGLARPKVSQGGLVLPQ
jgi:hypothetical protein